MATGDGPRFSVGDHVEQFFLSPRPHGTGTVFLTGTVIDMEEANNGWLMHVRTDASRYQRAWETRVIHQSQLRSMNVLDRLARET
jgi:hypothetical protein